MIFTSTTGSVSLSILILSISIVVTLACIFYSVKSLVFYIKELRSETIQETFIAFLKRNNCYNAFVKNYCSEYNYSLNIFLKEVDPEGYISTAFVWKGSLKERSFWLSLDCKWGIKVRSLRSIK